jgi:GR25 family glycosyltransferase involved in LPS biosynthesis
MNNPFDYFTEIYCINLEKRQDRWQHAQKEFEKVGILDRVERVSGIESGEFNGNVGCNKSHIKCVELARKRKIDNVLVLEDDVIFINDTLKILDKAVKQLDFPWHMLYLGANTHQSLVKIKPNLSLLKVGFALHAAVYNKKIYDPILDNFKCKDFLDPKNILDFYDVWLANKIQTKYTCLVCSPIIATQYNDFSDIQKKVVDYSFIEERAKNNIK